MSKQEDLLKLARNRQAENAAKWGPYKNLSDYHGGKYECPFVSPYTKSAGNVHARVMVFLQDWVSDNVLKRTFSEMRHKLGHDPGAPTNITLHRLLKTHLCLERKDIYATNLFPFIKKGSKKSRIPMKDMVRAAEEYGLPQLRIVKPTLVVCLGLLTFNALRIACGYEKCKRMSHAMDRHYSRDGTLVFCQAHTGNMGQNNRGREQVEKDWRQMALVYRESVSRKR